MENTNFRYSKLADFTSGQPEFASIDVSFISLKLILPVLKQILKTGGSVVSLIKPQFEAGREKVGKHGIVRDRKVHEEVLKNVLTMANAEGFDVLGLDYSPIKGGEGNIEFLAWLSSTDAELGSISSKVNINEVIDRAYSNLNS